eukprot:CAMPEP_0115830654 /NCGR_PEP_ID=MMETSP0287-20121206/1727_1 /TAXON_ID=412157 /ORGANISM="Chrysochromulina rotalis, Strain UIO044" /LENGTH=305 /DNA_ID=CAMNT_0003283961 /DNA_START=12 /DNA_END=929 /DNA_ORIENTATION=-
MLAQRGVSTAGVYERPELLRLLRESNGVGQSTELGVPLLPVETMHLQDVMSELDSRNIEFDVLTPVPTLHSMLREARQARSGAEQWAPPSHPSELKTSAPSAARRSSQGRDRQHPRQAQQTFESAPIDYPSIPTAADVESVWAAAQPAWHAAQRDLIPFITDTVEAAAEQVKPVAATAVKATTGSRARIVEVARSRLRRVQLPPKPILLAVCISALRFGITRTLLSALSLKLALEVGQDVRAALGERSVDTRKHWQHREEARGQRDLDVHTRKHRQHRDGARGQKDLDDLYVEDGTDDVSYDSGC